jgi:hypothetical protein
VRGARMRKDFGDFNILQHTVLDLSFLCEPAAISVGTSNPPH